MKDDARAGPRATTSLRKLLPMWFTESLAIRGSLFLLASAATAAGPSSCSKEEPPVAKNESLELIDLLEAHNKRHDPHLYVEIDLGKYKVTHDLGGENGFVLVNFHLFGVLPQVQQAKFAHDLPLYEKRVRDAVISLVQEAETEQLTDPNLALLKSDLVMAINRVLQGRVLKDVAFSEYSFNR